MAELEDVLVVEDEPMIAEMLSSVLEDEGFRVTRAATGLHAIEYAASAIRPFAYLVTDVNLGGELDGFDVARAVIGRHAFAHTVFLTGDPARSHQHRAPQGAVILEKPCMPHELVAALRI